MAGLLEVQNLSISFFTLQGEAEAVRKVGFSLGAGETLALVGESGCGKSALCKGIMRLLPATARIKSGSVCVKGVDITRCRERDMHKLRGSRISMVFQDSMTAWNPSITVGAQIAEAVKAHRPGISRAETERRTIELLELVGIDRARERMGQYPHQFSGGMRQRGAIAAALAGEPEILLADEPTTALDVTIQAQILDLLQRVKKKLGMGILFVTHDLGVAARVADRVAVMYAGKIVEIGAAEEIYYAPRHPYTWGLLQAHPFFARGEETLRAIPGMPPALLHPPKGDAFAWRNPYALGIDYEEEPPMFRVSDTHFAATWLLDSRAPKVEPPVLGKVSKAAKREGKEETGGEILLDVQHLTHLFPLRRGKEIRAVDNVSFQIRKGEIFGLVGESGSGKSTVARCIMNIYRPYSGHIFYSPEGERMDLCDRAALRKNRKCLQASRQLIFQDSSSSLNPRMKVGELIAEPMKIHHFVPHRGSWREEARFQMHYVGLEAGCLEQYPGELSGGQRQRVAIARALCMEPKLLVADEPIASLDVSIQAQIVNLFKHLQKEHGFSFLFIAHDLAMVEFLCDRVGVMSQGKLVEVAATRELFQNPQHPYTKALLDAMPVPQPKANRGLV